MKNFNRCKTTSTTAGTADMTLDTPPVGFKQLPASEAFIYVIEMGAEWEIGSGTTNAGPTTLTRLDIFENHLGTLAKVNFSAGSKTITIAPISHGGLVAFPLIASPAPPSVANNGCFAIGDGASCGASATDGAIALGRSSSASQPDAITLGRSAQASGARSIALGNSANCNSLADVIAWGTARPRFALSRAWSKITEHSPTPGLAQLLECEVSVATADSTVTPMGTWAIPTNTTWGFEINVVGRRRSSAQSYPSRMSFFRGAVKNLGGTATFIGGSAPAETVVAVDTDGDGFMVSFATSVDVTGSSFRVKVKGAGTDQVRWVGVARFFEIQGG